MSTRENSPLLTPEQNDMIAPFIETYVNSVAYSQERKKIIIDIVNKLGKQFTETQIRQLIQNRISRSKNKHMRESAPIAPKYITNSYQIYQPNPVPDYMEVSTSLNDPFYEQNTFRDDKYVWICYKKEKRVKDEWAMYFKCSNCNSKMNIHKKKTGKLTYDYKNQSHKESCIVDQYLKEISDLHLLDMKAQAIESYRISKGQKSTVAIAAEIAHVAHKSRIEDPNKLVPVVTTRVVNNWINNAKPIKSSEQMQLEIPHEIKTPDGVNLYHRQSKTHPSVMHFFFTEDALVMSSQTTRLLLDGTFRTTPPGFYQVFNGQGYDLKSGSYYPIFHVLLQRSDEETYFNCLLEIVALLSFNSLNKILVDFEQASIRGIERVLVPNHPKAVIQGCYFHFTKALRTKIDSYPAEIKSQLHVIFEVLILTPFISLHNIGVLMDYLGKVELLCDCGLIDYWHKTWGFNGLFKPSLWNTSDKIDKEFITTDGIERFHREMDDKLGLHQKITDFVRILYDIDVDIQHKVQNNQTNCSPKERITQNECLTKIKSFLKQNDLQFIYEAEKPIEGIIIRRPILKSSVNTRKPVKPGRGRPPKADKKRDCIIKKKRKESFASSRQFPAENLDYQGYFQYCPQYGGPFYCQYMQPPSFPSLNPIDGQFENLHL